VPGAQHGAWNGKGIEMKQSTAVKTGRTAAMQTRALAGRGSFRDYAAMVDRFSAGYLRTLTSRHAARRNAS
jgi:hypothetical protein